MNRKKLGTQISLIVILFSILSTVLITSNLVSNPPQISNLLVVEHETDFIPYVLPTQVTPIFESEILKTNQDSIAVMSAIDNNGNIIVVGYTRASNIITKNAFQTDLKGNFDVFISKYRPEGSLIWRTYLGGGGNDIVYDITVNKVNNDIYITGWTASTDFPTLNPKNSTLQGNWDLFLTSFNENGQLIYSTYWGTPEGDEGLGMAINKQNTELAIVGRSIIAGDNQILVLKYDLVGKIFTEELIFGGVGLDIAWDVAYDTQDSLYIIGDTQSANFPLLGALQTSYSGNQDGFIQKYADNMTLLYSSYIGGSNNEMFRSIASTGSNSVILGGNTQSKDYPGNISVFGNFTGDTIILSLLDLSANNISSIEIGGNKNDQLLKLVTDDDSIYFVGRTSSTSGLILQNPFQQLYGGGLFDGLIGKLPLTLDSVQFLSYLGNKGDDQILGLSLAKNNVLIAVGRTNSTNFLNSQTTGFKNSFLTKIGDFSDADQDNIPLWYETKYGLNRSSDDSNQDKDSDLLTNKQEFYLGFNPNDPSDGLNDSDGDKMANGWEVKYELNPFDNSDALLSYDGDQLTNLAEFLYNFDPISDNDQNIDSDGDGLENYLEVVYQLDPRNPDSDEDGFSDYDEIITFGFLGSSASQKNDNPAMRVISLVILTLVIYSVFVLIAFIYSDRKEKVRIKNEKKIKEIQLLIDTTNQDFTELTNQIDIIEDNFKSLSGNPKEINSLNKTILSLSESFTDLEVKKIKLKSYRNNPLLTDSVLASINQITNILNRYKGLQSKLNSNEGNIVLHETTENLCSNCFTILTAISKECFNCKSAIQICGICKKGLFSGQETSSCIHCNNQFHHGHFAETVKIQGRCPICLVSVTFDEITSHKL